MNFDNVGPHLKTTFPGTNQEPTKAITLIKDPITPRVEINLKAFTEEEGLPPSIAAREAIGRLIAFITDENEKRINIHCGDPHETCLGGLRYTGDARQAQKDVADLTSRATLETIQNRTGESISVKQFNDPVDGNPVISYKVEIS